MLDFANVLAYFGPEVQLPVTSLIGAIVGFVMMVGTAPLRMLKDRLTGRGARP